MWIIGSAVVVLILLLGGAAFVGGQLFRQGQQAQAKANTESLPRKLVTPAPGVPTTAPDGSGDVSSRNGNSIFICAPSSAPSINPDGTVNQNGACGPEVEVVIGHDTLFLHDVTARQYGNSVRPTPGQDLVLTQAVEPGSPDDIGVGTAVRAWGTMSGNRLIGRTIVYWNRAPAPSGTPGS